MKDSQLSSSRQSGSSKYIKANNERFSTPVSASNLHGISISRRIMKDSQPMPSLAGMPIKYIKANNERFSTP